MTKSRQVEQKLRRAIIRGNYAPGTPLPTEMELLDKYGVSRTTLRDALNALANDGLLERRQGSGTFVSESLKKNCIAILAHLEHYTSAVGHYTRTLVDELNEFITSAGYQPNFIIGQGKTVQEFSDSVHLLDRPVAKKIAGVISLMELGEFADYLNNAEIPNVSIVISKSRSKHCILLNYEKIASMVKDTFASYGIHDYAVMYHKPIAEQFDDEWSKEYRLSVEHSVNSPNRLLPVDFNWDFGHAYDVFKKWWNTSDRPNAIFFFDDGLCDMASRVFLEYDIKIPQDLQVLSFANKNRKFHLPYKLTTIGYDLEHLASIAWQKLYKLINGESADDIVTVEPCLFDGSSLSIDLVGK